MSQRSLILLVDDEPRVLSALRRRLAGAFDVLTAQSGPEALNVLAGAPDVAVVVADMKMPGIDGVALLAAVKNARPEVSRIMLTGNADLETAMAAVNTGQVLRFLRKPCDPVALRQAIDQGVEDHRFRRSPPAMPKDADIVEARRRAKLLGAVGRELRAPAERLLDLSQNIVEARIAGPLATPEDLAARQDAEQLAALSARLARFVARLLDLGRMAEGAAHERVEACDLVAAARAVVQEAGPAAARRGVTISLSCAADRIDAVVADADIRLALRELIANAVRHNRAGGHISVALNCDRDAAAVRVLDTGAGLPGGIGADGVEALALHPKGGGDSAFGLGLTIVSAVAAAHGGAFVLSSTPNLGASATLTFPRRWPALRAVNA